MRASSATTSGLVDPTDSAAVIAGEHVGTVEMAVQQQHLDQRPGARRVAVSLAGGGPERLVLGGEHPRGAGLGQRGSAGQRAGLAQQDLQIVVQIKDFDALADRPLMSRHHRCYGQRR